MSSPLLKPSTRREVLIHEHAYHAGYNDGLFVAEAHNQRELWRARHPIRYAIQRLKAHFFWRSNRDRMESLHG